MKSILTPVATLVGSLALVVGASVASAAPPDLGNSHTVTIDNFAFAPADITVPVGTTLTWTNLQNVRHTSTADNGQWDSDILTSGKSFDVTMNTVGDFAYHCDVHPDMLGVVHVIAAAAEDTASASTGAADPANIAVANAAAAAAAENQAPVVDQSVTVAPTPAPTQAPQPKPTVVNGYGY